MNALHFLVTTLIGLYLLALLLRFIMQLVRANFRNEIGAAIISITNPVILPLRKVLPAAGKIDTANLVAIVLIAALEVGVSQLLLFGNLPNPLSWLMATGVSLVRTVIYFYMGALFIYVVLSWVAPGGQSPAMWVLNAIVEPFLAPFRRIVPPLGGIDFSPLWAGLFLGVVLRLLGLG
jgi:YggT family protein